MLENILKKKITIPLTYRYILAIYRDAEINTIKYYSVRRFPKKKNSISSNSFILL